jgi:hypothetical protein
MAKYSKGTSNHPVDPLRTALTPMRQPGPGASIVPHYCPAGSSTFAEHVYPLRSQVVALSSQGTMVNRSMCKLSSRNHPYSLVDPHNSLLRSPLVCGTMELSIQTQP